MTKKMLKNPVILSDAQPHEGSPNEILRPPGAQNDVSGVFQHPAKDSAVSVSVLRSSSSGNSTLIWNRKHAILVDCGLGPRVTEGLLKPLGFSIRDLSGVLVTHAHNDHSKLITVERFFRHEIPVYCVPGVRKVVLRGLSNKHKPRFRIFARAPFTVGSFRITSFPVDHDAEGGCVGFCIFSGEGEMAKKISLVTDYGGPGELIAESLRDSHLILIASNYCSEMIKGPSPVPEYVKRSHILPYQPSNDHCSGVLLHVVRSSAILPEAVYLLHISKNHNTVEKAVAHSKAMLHAAGYKKIRILPTFRDASSETVHLK
jgi:phosphoribosyl 1,2-cyclic phosphodiesterase